MASFFKERRHGMKDIIIPFSKSPHPSWRVGPEYKQDWYQSLIKTVHLSHQLDAGILVLSSFQAKNSDSEADIYARVLTELGCTEVDDYSKLGANKFLVVRECNETIGQVKYVRDVVMNKWHMCPIFISTFTHYLRVQWLLWRILDQSKDFGHKIAWGRPRPFEFWTDLVLTFWFPIIDLCGGSNLFQSFAQKKRAKGFHI